MYACTDLTSNSPVTNRCQEEAPYGCNEFELEFGTIFFRNKKIFNIWSIYPVVYWISSLILDIKKENISQN